MTPDPLGEAYRAGLLRPALNDRGVRIGWVLTRQGRRVGRARFWPRPIRLALVLTIGGVLAGLMVG